MSDPTHTVHMDRIVLIDLAVTPDRQRRERFRESRNQPARASVRFSQEPWASARRLIREASIHKTPKTTGFIGSKSFTALPDRVDHIQELLEIELRRLLTREGFGDPLTGREVPTVHQTEPHDDRHLAQGLAQSIAQAPGGVD